MDAKLPEGRRIAGTRQVLRALSAQQALVVFLARDAESRIQDSVLSACREQGVPLREIATMQLLGRLMKLSVPTAAGAILREGND